MTHELPKGVTRASRQPLLSDIVTVSDPDLIRQFAASPLLGRPGHVQLPTTLSYFFMGTKFNSAADKTWALPMEAKDNPTYAARRAAIEKQVAGGFSAAQLARFDALVAGDTSPRDIGAECARLLAPMILPLNEGEELSDEVAYACFDTVQTFGDFLNPLRYMKCRSNRKLTEDFVRKLLPDEQNVMDYVHNLGAAAQGMSDAVLALRASKDGDTAIDALVRNPLIPSIMRMPTERTTMDGMFPEDQPLEPGKTVVVLNIAEAAKETRDPLFLLGAGIEERKCPFLNNLMNAVEGVGNRS